MSSVVFLYIVLIQGVLGTFFPPVSNPPPIPGQSIRTLENSPQAFYVQENLPNDFSSSLVKDGLLSSEEKVEEQRWYLQENQSGETGRIQSSTEEFDRYYQSGEPAIGPVATPIPDDAYLSQPSSISKLSPNEAANSNVWILTRGSDNPIPERWIQLQLPAERFVEVVNQDSGPPLATDTVKSVVAPVTSEVPVKTQFTANTLANIIQQVWVRSPNTLGSQLFGSPSDFAQGVPSVKQIVDVPTGNVKQVVQQQIFKDDSSVPIPDPGPAPVISKKSFTVPPPPPPPLKGFDPTSKFGPSIPVNTIPDSNVLVSDNGPFRRIRHIWVATSPRTGKFISYALPNSINTGKSIGNIDVSQDPTPIAVSDTWVLKQGGPIPSFEQTKSALPPPQIQSGKVIFQDPPVIKVEAPPSPPIVAQVDSPKNPTGKSLGLKTPVDIWPARNDIKSSKTISKYSGEIAPQLLPASPKSDDIVITKSLQGPPVIPQKALPNLKSPIPPPLPPPPAKVVSGKPCPLPPPPPQRYLFSPRSPSMIALPRAIPVQKRPSARIVRVNRYPSGSYYLLNNRIRPSLFTYPNSALLQQPKLQFVRLVQPNQIPFPLQGKQPSISLQTKQIPIPQQPRQLPAPVPAKQVYPFRARQTIVPVTSAKSPRLIYPALQPIKYLNPWNGYSNPVPGKGVYIPQFSPQKVPLPVSASDSSSESSSESSSSESEDKKEKLKEEKPKNEESSGSDERERESSSQETEASEESASEVKSEEESIEAAESQISHALTEVSNPHIPQTSHHENIAAHHQEISDAEGSATASYLHSPPETSHVSANHDSTVETNEPNGSNSITNQVTNSDEKPHHGSEGSIDDITTVFIRD